MDHKLLFVDDEPTIVAALERVFIDDDHTILTATSGAQALEILRNNKISLLITDMRMPQMDGVQLLEHVCAVSPETIRFVLTGYADKDSTISAINRGNAHYYLLKPWDNQGLRLVVNQYLREFELKSEVEHLQNLTKQQNEQLRRHNEELESLVHERTAEITRQNAALESANARLKNSYYSTVKVLGNTIEMYDPALGGHGTRVATHSLLLARKMGLDSEYCYDIYVAALLHDIGLIGVTPQVLKKYRRRLPLDSEELEVFHRHPVTGEKLIRLNDSCERVSKLIRQHHENYDGSGYPDSLSGLQIMVGAQIISVADRYDEMINRPDTNISVGLHDYATSYLRETSRFFDSDVIGLYLELLKNEKMRAYQECAISISELREGMVLSRHIYSSSSLLLLAAGSKVNAEQAMRLANSRLVPAGTKVYIHDFQFNATLDGMDQADDVLKQLSYSSL
ncbi:MAG TPA: HD domain-containing phosphohydrolase [Blastocatellia bacterium]|nr:HD domain-containing phosphohydrolase [Blastocatellia bacterium]